MTPSHMSTKSFTIAEAIFQMTLSDLDAFYDHLAGECGPNCVICSSCP